MNYTEHRQVNNKMDKVGKNDELHGTHTLACRPTLRGICPPHSKRKLQWARSWSSGGLVRKIYMRVSMLPCVLAQYIPYCVYCYLRSVYCILLSLFCTLCYCYHCLTMRTCRTVQYILFCATTIIVWQCGHTAASGNYSSAAGRISWEVFARNLSGILQDFWVACHLSLKNPLCSGSWSQRCWNISSSIQ